MELRWYARKPVSYSDLLVYRKDAGPARVRDAPCESGRSEGAEHSVISYITYILWVS